MNKLRVEDVSRLAIVDIRTLVFPDHVQGYPARVQYLCDRLPNLHFICGVKYADTDREQLITLWPTLCSRSRAILSCRQFESSTTEFVYFVTSSKDPAQLTRLAGLVGTHPTWFSSLWAQMEIFDLDILSPLLDALAAVPSLQTAGDTDMLQVALSRSLRPGVNPADFPRAWRLLKQRAATAGQTLQFPLNLCGLLRKQHWGS
jgi:hypothetical protein